MTNGEHGYKFPHLTPAVVWSIILIIVNVSSIWYNTLGGQSQKIGENKTDLEVQKVLLENANKSVLQMNENLNLIRAESNGIRREVAEGDRQIFSFVHAGHQEIFGWLLGGKTPKIPAVPKADDTTFRPVVGESTDLLVTTVPPAEIEREKYILRRLQELADKQKNGELTLEEAIHMGELSDQLSDLKQRQILRSIQGGHSTIDCRACRKLCGPVI